MKSIMSLFQRFQSAIAQPSNLPDGKQAVDVSFWNENIDWDTAAPYLSLAIVRAMQGEKDSKFDRNWAALKKHPEIIPGAYYFWQGVFGDQKGMAHRFLDIVQPGPNDLVAIDLEAEYAWEKANKRTPLLQERILTWCEEIKNGIGQYPLIYTSPGWWNAYACTLKNFGLTLVPPVWASKMKLWVANYTAANKPLLPAGWGSWLIWQFGSEGTCKGITTPSAKRLDVNRLSVSPEALRVAWNPKYFETTPPIQPPVNYLAGSVVVDNGVWLHTRPDTSLATRIRLLPRGDRQKIVDLQAPYEVWARNDNNEWFAMTYDGEKLVAIG